MIILTWISGTSYCQVFPSSPSATTELPFWISPPTQTCPFRTGFSGSSMLYCRTSPCSQLTKYRNRSSREMRKSVTSPGISGRIQFCTFNGFTDIATWKDKWLGEAIIIEWHYPTNWNVIHIENRQYCPPFAYLMAPWSIRGLEKPNHVTC